ncbi:MAG: hypothetical protein H6684_08520 [Deltaproteobacteria bacterium]|nr:hypothetical protein [Deltaproteobacteria bacterium]MCB9488760.1 hypothetical protein [Deltaproteobacteria bacterium]
MRRRYFSLLLTAFAALALFAGRADNCNPTPEPVCETDGDCLGQCSASAIAADDLQFSFTDLEILSGSNATANDVNNHGVTVGWSTSSDGKVAVMWDKDGNAMSLGKASGAIISEAEAINDAGKIVGFSEYANQYYQAFAYADGAREDLGYAEDFDSTLAVGVSASGDVFGSAITLGSGSGAAAVRFGDEIESLGDLGGDYSRAWGASGGGIPVGYARTASSVLTATRFDGESPTALEFPDGNFASTLALDANDNGAIVGYGVYSTYLSPRTALQWINGAVQVLSAVNSGQSEARGVNASGWVVGESFTGHLATLWIDGEAHDLNDMTVDLPPGVELFAANGVNDNGSIVGIYTVSGQNGLGAFRLDPVTACVCLPDGGENGEGECVAP